jgi:intracellular septation protein
MTQTSASPAKSKTPHIVRAIVDYGGLIAFLVVYVLTKDLIKANWTLAATSAVAIGVGLVFERRLAPMPLLTGIAAAIFATLAQRFHDTRFVKMQPTAIDTLLGAVMLGGAAMKRNPLKALLGGALHMDAAAWRTLMIRYGLFFLAEAILNEIFWRTQPEATWVVWHRPFFLVLSVVFSLAQAPFLMKHAQMGDAPPETDSETKA